jgi:hypothetical protein
VFRAHLRTVHYLKLQDYRSAYLTTAGRSAIVRRSLVAAATTSKKRRSRPVRRGRRSKTAPAPPANENSHQPAKAVTGSPHDDLVEPGNRRPVLNGESSKEQKISTVSFLPSASPELANKVPVPVAVSKYADIEPVGSLQQTTQSRVFVDNFEDSCLCLCKLCGQVYPVDSIRSHLKIAHLSNIRLYREEHGSLEYVRETYLR